MNSRDLKIFFGLEVFAIIWAGVLFSVLPSKLVAGGLAGLYFVGSGLFMLYRAVQWPRHWSSLVWYVLLVHVFVISLPMLLGRFFNSDIPFEQLHIMGLSGPQFHQVSSIVFSGLMLATVIDWLRARAAAGKSTTAV